MMKERRMRHRESTLLICLATAILAMVATVASGATLDAVKQRGALSCGVNHGLPGFSDHDAQGKWSGFDVDFCRAVAAAIFDDPTKVSFVPLSASERFDALRAGTIDVLARNSTWTLEREAGLGLLFVAITFHDGQGFMVERHPEIVSALELGGANICVQKGTTTQLNLADYFRANSMQYHELTFDAFDDALKALESGQCDVFTADQSALWGARVGLAKPGAGVILPDVISKEPLGPVVRSDDVAWFDIIKWVAFALVNAEELGVDSSNIAEALASTKPDVRRFVGAEGDLGRSLGLDNAWATRAVRAVGNYSEIFERNVGSRSRLGIPRGLNQLWSTGGILYAPPLR
jgi:general L-amino acid transport system substrate-binding protein